MTVKGFIATQSAETLNQNCTKPFYRFYTVSQKTS